MKRLICSIALVLSAIILQAQPYTIPQSLNNVPLGIVNTNALKGKLIIATFADTTALNAEGHLKFYDGALAKTVTPNATWWRDLLNQVWVQYIPGGGGSGVQGWQIGGNFNWAGSSTGNEALGWQTGITKGINFTTSGVTNVALNSGGLIPRLSISDTTLNKPMVWNTSDKTWGYGYWYGSGGGGGSQTWQQTLVTGSTLNQNNLVDAGRNSFTMYNATDILLYSGNVAQDTIHQLRADYAAGYAEITSARVGRSSWLRAYTDSVSIFGNLIHLRDSSINSSATNGYVWTLTDDNDGEGTWKPATSIANEWHTTGNAGTNPATNFVGTTDGQDFVLKANNTEFQRLVPYTGTETGKWGYVINSNYVTSPGDFAAQITSNGAGTTGTPVAGGISLSVTAADFSRTFNIPTVWPSSVLPKETYRAVGIATALTNGLILAQEVATLAPSYWARLWVEYNFNAKTAVIKLQNAGGVTILASSSALASISTGDSIACTFDWDYNIISATITNLNTAATATVSTGFSAPNYAPTIYNPCTFFPVNTNPTVLQSLQVYVDAYKRPDINFVGHSVLQGYAGVTVAQLVPSLITGFMPSYKTQVDAMGSMKIADVQFWMDEIQKIHGDYVALMIGANDPGGTTNDATFYSGYRALRDSIVAGGSQVIHFGQLPQSGYDFGPRNDSLKTLYESLGDIFIDIFPLLKNTVGSDYLPYYDVGDGIHPSAAGDSLIASQFMLAIAPILNKPVNTDYVDFSKILNLQGQAFYENQLFFNSNRSIVDKGYVDSSIAANIVPIPLAIGDNITNATAGSIFFGGTGGTFQQKNAGLFFDSTNIRLGIGTATPSYKVHAYESVNGSTGINVENASAGTGAETYMAVRNNAGGYGSIAMFSSTNPSFPSYTQISTNGSGLIISAVNAVPIVFKNNSGNERLTILGNGNVGVNTIAPDSTFHVTGGLKFVTGRQGAGKVLTSDVGGGADWADPAACATCVTAASTLTSNQLMIGGGSRASSTTTTGTNVLTALGVNVGSAGAFVVNGGALGTPSSGTLTNATGLPVGGISATGTPDNTTYLRGDGTWNTPAGGSGVTTVGAFNTTSTANAASISGSTITMHQADGTNPGAASSNQIRDQVGITTDGQGTVVSTGSKAFYTVPFSGTITTWYITSTTTGSIVFDIKRSGTSIIGGGGNKPTLSSATSANAAVSGWTSTTVTAGDILEWVVDSASTLVWANVVVRINKN